MTHLTLDELNQMFAQKATEEERACWTDHLLECESCATRFKTMHALHLEMGVPQKTVIPWRYTLGAAAVIFMCAFPYFRPVAEAPRVAVNVQVEKASSSEFALLEQIKEVNYRDALQRWGKDTDLTTLVQLSSK